MNKLQTLLSKYLTDADKIYLERTHKCSRNQLDNIIKGKRSNPDLFSDALNIALSNSFLLYENIKPKG